MKKILILSFLLVCVSSYAQKLRFNKKLNQFCELSTKEFTNIPTDRKAVLEKIANEIAQKKYVVFTCQTNTRRTQLLQTWMQTAFYYYGIFNKMSFSYGDTVSEIYSGITDVLERSGFTISKSNTKPTTYVFYISERYQQHGIFPKIITGIDQQKSVVISICVEGEAKSTTGAGAFELPYESPRSFENTAQEKQKYTDLNKQISVEMLYLAERVRDIVLGN